MRQSSIKSRGSKNTPSRHIRATETGKSAGLMARKRKDQTMLKLMKDNVDQLYQVMVILFGVSFAKRRTRPMRTQESVLIS